MNRTARAAETIRVRAGYPAAEALGPLPLDFLSLRFLDFIRDDPYTPGIVDAVAQEFVSGAKLPKQALLALTRYVMQHESEEFKFIWIRLLNPKVPLHKRLLMNTLDSTEPGLSVAAGVRLGGTLGRADIERLLKRLMVEGREDEASIEIRENHSTQQLLGYLEALKGVSGGRVTDFRKLARARVGLARSEF